jgi:type IV secretion system protein VirB4
MARRGHRTLTDFTRTVQNQAIRQVFQEYTVAGSMGHVFDAEQDSLDGFGDFTVFEMQELLGLDDKFKLPILWYLFRRIEKSLRGQPAAIILDEASRALGNAFFRERIEVWLREMRKANCAVIMATQGLGDADRSGILDVLNESTATKIFLPNPAAREKGASELYERFGLNPRQVELLATAIPKREYYLVSEEGCRLFDLALGPLALAFLAVSDKDTLAEVRRCEAVYGEGWVDEWLSRRGLSLRDYVSTQTNLTELVSV